eukprot:GHVH01005934.1.p1 GENE.GHVH01005934.1~~GHVH01005934.1.p1  ORF type:complete len:169 (+),score=32.86 GHVH01005934.1:154-660(+)
MQIDHFEMKSNESPLNKWTNWRNEDDWFREDKQGSPQPDYPMTYDDQSDDDGRGEAEDQCFIEEAEAAQVDYEIMDWLFKCMTLTLLSLILLGVIIILVKVWNPVGSAPEEEGLGGAPRAVGGAQPGVTYDHRNPHDYLARNGSRATSRLANWLGKSAFGKTGSKLIG